MTFTIQSTNVSVDKLIKDSGYHYITEEGIEMVEHHVDASEEFHFRMKDETYGGKLSVRMQPNEKPLMIIGHDESIFKQYLITKKAWTLPTGETQLVPKDEGAGVMISAFQSRDFGFGHPLTNEQLEGINQTRRGRSYFDIEAAKRQRGKAEKEPLKESPFIIEFEYGANNEGYWTYDNMVLQLDDCVDCLNYLYPNYEFLFMLDHSSGHDKQKPDALNATNMKVKFGGKQKVLRDSIILEQDGYLGPYHHNKMLQVGDTQSFVFSDTDDGPFYLQDRNERRLDRNEGIIEKELSKEALTSALRSRNILTKGSKSQLQALCRSNGIQTKKQIPKVIEGWVGKAKGKLQILWERGMIDEANLNKYTNDGKVDAFGILDKNYSLHYLMTNCKDFIEEESMLQSMGREMGVTIDRTPICHAELAGEGIEYSWGCSKNEYRRQPLSMKRKKEGYRELVKKSMSREILTTERVRLFAKRARSYVCAYYQLHHSGINDHDILDANLPEQVKIERLAKKYKTHRSAVDFNAGFITSVVKSTPQSR